MKIRALLAAFLICSVVPTYHVAGQFIPTTQLLPTVDFPMYPIQRGFGVDISSTFIAAGVPEVRNSCGPFGGVEVYDAVSLNHVINIGAPDLTENSDEFGRVVAVSDRYLVIGAPFLDTPFYNCGGVFVVDLTAADPQESMFLIENPSPDPSDEFGYSVDIDGSLLIVGAENNVNGPGWRGTAFAFDLDTDSPQTPVAVLPNPTGESGEMFGFSVAICGRTVVVGAPDCRGSLTNDEFGCCYVFSLNSTDPLSPRVVIPNPAPSRNDDFGWDVDIDGDIIAVCDRSARSGSYEGLCYVYDLNSTRNVQPVFIAHGDPDDRDYAKAVAVSGRNIIVGTEDDHAYLHNLDEADPAEPALQIPAPPEASYRFSLTIGIQGDRIVVGDPQGGPNSDGRTYVYDLSASNPDEPQAELFSDHRTEVHLFGASMAASADYLVVGAVNNAAPGNPAGIALAGAAYVFDSSSPQSPPYVLFSTEPAVRHEFAQAVATDGPYVAVGEPYNSVRSYRAGRAYVFDMSGTDPDTPVITIENSIPNSQIGRTLDMSGTRLVTSYRSFGGLTSFVGVWDLASSDPTTPMLTLTNPDSASQGNFGNKVLIDGSRVFVDAWTYLGTSVARSVVYVFDLNSQDPRLPVLTIEEPSRSTFERFGTQMNVDGDILVIGAPADGTLETFCGRAYVYDLGSATPEQPIHILEHPNPAYAEFFGTSISVEGSSIIVSAPESDYRAEKSGVAYVFDLKESDPTVPIATLLSPVAEECSPENNLFGSSVAHLFGLPVIGSRLDNSRYGGSGAAYIYSEDSSSRPSEFTEPGSNTDRRNLHGLPSTNRRVTFTCPQRKINEGRVVFEDRVTASVSSPQQIELTIEWASVQRNGPGVRIEFFDFDADRWDLVTEATPNEIQSRIVVAADQNPSRFVQPGTNFVEVRVGLDESARRPRSSMTIDRLRWVFR